MTEIPCLLYSPVMVLCIGRTDSKSMTRTDMDSKTSGLKSDTRDYETRKFRSCPNIFPNYVLAEFFYSYPIITFHRSFNKQRFVQNFQTKEEILQKLSNSFKYYRALLTLSNFFKFLQISFPLLSLHTLHHTLHLHTSTDINFRPPPLETHFFPGRSILTFQLIPNITHNG